MTLRVYIAGSSQELARALAASDAFDAAVKRLGPGCQLEITNRWWDTVLKRGCSNPVDAPFHERMRYAQEDLQGVRDADILWLLYPTNGLRSVGCYWEAGYADALGLEVIISGPGQLNSIFTTRGACFETDEAALVYLEQQAFFETKCDAIVH